MRLTSPCSPRGAGGVHLAQKQLGSAVLFGKGGRGQLRARGSVARSDYSCLLEGARSADSLARCGAANGLVKRLSREPLAISPAARARIPHFAPRPAKAPGCIETVWKNLPLISESERQTRAGEGTWMALIRSGLPRAWPSCLEKPGAGRCGKWLFGFAAELLNLLDRLSSPQSLPTGARQFFRTGRGIQGKQT